MEKGSFRLTITSCLDHLVGPNCGASSGEFWINAPKASGIGAAQLAFVSSLHARWPPRSIA